MIDVLATLQLASVEVIEVAGWQTRERAGSFTPIGQMDHHTAAKATATRPAPSLNTCVYGRPDLAAPLCNGLIDYFGRVWLISDGRANDSGAGSGKVLDELKRGILPTQSAAQRRLPDTVNGNPWFWDWEVEYPGGSFSPNDAQLEALVRVNVAFYLAGGGWPIAHREWTARKPDPANVDMLLLRAEVRRRVDALAASASGTAPFVAAEPKPTSSVVAPTVHRSLLEGEPVARYAIRIQLDGQGDGDFPICPVDKFISLSNAAPLDKYAPGGQDTRSLVVPVGTREHAGTMYAVVAGGPPNQFVYPRVTVAD